MSNEVTMHVAAKLVLGHEDVEISVKSDGRRLGKLLLSKGNIEWFPSPNSVNKHRLSWKNFATLMESQGRPARVA